MAEVYSKCPRCRQAVLKKELEKNFQVCPRCRHHSYLAPSQWVSLLADERGFKEGDTSLLSQDPLGFRANKSYQAALEQAQAKTGLKEAVLSGEGTLQGVKIVLSVMNFQFMGGSMGSVVGEKITRSIEKATEKRKPLIIVAASGGARMQEGMLSLMQMAKTSAALAKFHQAKAPFISVLTHPTTGGVAASFASLADVIIAEPQALIGFAGPRVIEDTIKQRLPKGFQTAEFLLEHGMVDMVVDRRELKDTLKKLLDFFVPKDEKRTTCPPSAYASGVGRRANDERRGKSG